MSDPDEERLREEAQKQHEAEVAALLPRLQQRDADNPDQAFPPLVLAHAIADLFALLLPVLAYDPKFERDWSLAALGYYVSIVRHPGLSAYLRDADNLNAINAMVQSLARHAPPELLAKLGGGQ